MRRILIALLISAPLAALAAFITSDSSPMTPASPSRVATSFAGTTTPNLDCPNIPFMQNLVPVSEPLMADMNNVSAGISQGNLTTNGLTNGMTFSTQVGQQDFAIEVMTWTATTTTMSVYVQMADGSVPVYSTTPSTGDLAFVVHGAPLYASGAIVTLISGTTYRVSLTFVPSNGQSSVGLWRESTSSGKGFTTTGWQVSLSSSAQTYLKTTGTTKGMGTASCLTWSGTTAVDVGGGSLVWQTTGAPTANLASTLFPGGTGDSRQGVGPFSDANWLRLYNSASDPLDSTGDRYGCIAFNPAASDLGVNHVLISNGSESTAGYVVNITTGFRFSSSTPTLFTAVSGASPIANTVNVGCWWRTGTAINVKLNLGTTVTNASADTEVAGTTNFHRIGRYEATTLPFGGTIYDMVQGLGAPVGFASVEAWATAQMNRAFTLGDSAQPLFFDNASDVIHLDARNFPSTQNILLQSEDATQAVWSNNGLTSRANVSTTLPDGTTGNAIKALENSSTGGHFLSQSITVSGTPTRYVSAYMKVTGRPFGWISADTSAAIGTFDATTCAATGGAGSGETYTSTAVGNGWCFVTSTRPLASGSRSAAFGMADVFNSSSYTANGTGFVLIYHPQETLDFPTSYAATTDLPAGIWRAPQNAQGSQNGTLVSTRAYAAPALQGKLNATGVTSFSDANYYVNGFGLDALDSTGDRWGCITYNPTAADLVGNKFLVSNGLASTAGYVIEINVSPSFTFRSSNPTLVSAFSSANVTPGAINIGCWWRTGTSIFAKSNLGSTGTNASAGTEVPGTAYNLKVGRGEAVSTFVTGTIYSVIQGLGPCPTPPPPFAATCEGWATWEQTKVLGHLAPLNDSITVTRATTTTVDFGPTFAGQSLWTVPTGIAPIGPTGVEVWKAGTNNLLQSSTSCVANAVQAPWALAGTPTCLSDVAVAPDGTTTMDEWTSVAITDRAIQTVTTASSTTFTGSAYMAKNTGTGFTGLILRCNTPATTPTTCTCGTSDGSACTPTISATDCSASFSAVTTTTIRGWVSATCDVATTIPGFFMAPGRYTIATGTARFWGAQVETGLYPTPYCPTGAGTCTRNATVVSKAMPLNLHDTNQWCASVTLSPGNNRGWLNTASQGGLWSGLGDAANTWSIRISSAGQAVFRVVDNAAGQKNANSTAGALTGASRRITGCNNAGSLSICVDGVPGFTQAGAGTGLLSSSNATGYIGYDGNGSQVFHFDGSAANAVVCAGATSCAECP